MIFCILEVDFAISVITLFVVFDEAFQKALVDKSVCVINIAHLIVLSAFKNPLFDAYFNRVTALLTVRFLSVMGAYLGPPALFALIFYFAVRTYLGPPALFATRFSFAVRTYLGPPHTLCIELLTCYGSIFGTPRTLCIDICISRVRINISDISLFGFRRSYFLFLFPFYKRKKLNRFLRILDFSEFQIFENFRFLRILDF